MICIAISRMKNEADIVEAYVRHHAHYFDRIIVLDDDSTDGTYEILHKLTAAGLPLVVLREPHIGKDQSRFMTRLMHTAFDEFHADWVAPLDADEFIELPPSASLAQLLPEHSDTTISLYWSNFIWSGEDHTTELNPVIRLRRCMPPRRDVPKVLIPAAAGASDEAIMWQGNHAVSVRGMRIPAVDRRDIRLCHYPIRSVSQYASKMAIGYLQYAAFADRTAGMGFQYDEPFRLLKTGWAEFSAQMERQSRAYSLAGSEDVDETPSTAPLHYAGGALEFTRDRDQFLSNLLHYVEALAEQSAERDRERNAFEELLLAVTPEMRNGSARDRIVALARYGPELERALEQAASDAAASAREKSGLERSLDEARTENNALAADKLELRQAVMHERARNSGLAAELASAGAGYLAHARQLESPVFLTKQLLETCAKRLFRAAPFRRAPNRPPRGDSR